MVRRNAITVVQRPAWLFERHRWIEWYGSRRWPAELLSRDTCEDSVGGGLCGKASSWWLLQILGESGEYEWEQRCHAHAMAHPRLWRKGGAGMAYMLLRHTDPLMRPADCEDCWQDRAAAHEAGRPVPVRYGAKYVVRRSRRGPMRHVCRWHADRYVITMHHGGTVPATKAGRRFWRCLDGRRHDDRDQDAIAPAAWRRSLLVAGV